MEKVLRRSWFGKKETGFDSLEGGPDNCCAGGRRGVVVGTVGCSQKDKDVEGRC